MAHQHRYKRIRTPDEPKAHRYFRREHYGPGVATIFGHTVQVNSWQVTREVPPPQPVMTWLAGVWEFTADPVVD